jgi:phenylpropionate dioxygenase-like ring-hydroxylating dioxygenase large terminal subunit
MTRTKDRLVDGNTGLISRKIFFDPEIYAQELKSVFAKTWLFLGHESMIPEPDDYVTNYMGEDPVILWRAKDRKIRVFLNSCRHRGMRLCRTDFGNAGQFTCPFHGWTYSSDGRLVGVPFLKEAYFGHIDREKWGMFEVPRVSSYGGFIFGNMDSDCVSLDEYLGDLRWYLDVLLARPLGKIEVLRGRQRYECKSNWKIAGENFAGDTYHLPYSHGSLFRIDARWLNPVSYQRSPSLYAVATAHGHGLCAIAAAGERYKADQELAREMGREVVEYVEETQRRLTERLSAEQAAVYTIGFGNIFPNFSLNNFSALRPIGLYLWHPRGPSMLESWQWCALDSEAPKAVKDIIRVDFARQQATAGIAGQDDTENFEQVTEATRGAIGQELAFNYQMGLAESAAVDAPSALPGEIGPYYTEQGQRNFDGYWAELMGLGRTGQRRGVKKRANGRAAPKRKAKPAAHANAGQAGPARSNRPVARSTLQ